MTDSSLETEVSWPLTGRAFPIAFLILAAGRLSSRPVTFLGWLWSALAPPLTFARVDDGVVVVAFDIPLGLPPPLLQRLLRRVGGNQAVAPVPDQVCPLGFKQRFPHGEPVRRLEELHERPLELAVIQILRDLDRLFGERVEAG